MPGPGAPQQNPLLPGEPLRVWGPHPSFGGLRARGHQSLSVAEGLGQGPCPGLAVLRTWGESRRGHWEGSLGLPLLAPPLTLQIFKLQRRRRLVGGVQLPKSGQGMGGGASSKAYLVSGEVPGGLGASGPTWPPTIAAGSDPWPREALAGGAGALTGTGLVSLALEGLAAGEKEQKGALSPGPCD